MEDKKIGKPLTITWNSSDVKLPPLNFAYDHRTPEEKARDELLTYVIPDDISEKLQSLSIEAYRKEMRSKPKEEILGLLEEVVRYLDDELFNALCSGKTLVSIADVWGRIHDLHGIIFDCMEDKNDKLH